MKRGTFHFHHIDCKEKQSFQACKGQANFMSLLSRTNVYNNIREDQYKLGWECENIRNMKKEANKAKPLDH